jgi:cyclopropane-fatty-acyl-phospholipid synthase
MTLLEVGCGWGLTLQRAMEKYDVNVIGLTLSKNQQAYCTQLLDKLDTKRTHDVRLEGWEQFHAPVDRIVSIEAFEHFGFERYDDFFKMCFDVMPDDGRMTIQSSVGYHPYDLAERGKKLTFDLARFIKFMITEIFPGGRIPSTSMMVEHGEKAGFVVPEAFSLRNHYIKTLGIWADRLEAHKDEAIAATDEENYFRYMKYLKGCQYYFIDETIDVSLVTYLKPGAVA